MLAGRCRGFILKVKGKQNLHQASVAGGLQVQLLDTEAKVGGGGGELIGAERVAMAEQDFMNSF